MYKALIVNDLALGDSGKGSIVDYLTNHYNIKQVVRFSGGSQAAHHVVNNGKSYRFSQFGAGTLNGANTFLSKYMLVDPITLLDEADRLGEDYLKTLIIDEDVVVITFYHVLANRIKEQLRGNNKFGSCGCGIGETREDELNGFTLRVKDLKSPDLVYKLSEICERKTPHLMKETNLLNDLLKYYKEFSDKINTGKLNINQNLVFEGAQGMLLDETYGFNPHTTWTDVSYNKALDLLKGFNGNVIKLGLIRSYMTRHGAGPFVTEDNSLNKPELHNETNLFQDNFRMGHLDLVAIKYAIHGLGGIDGLVVNHMDYLEEESKICIDYSNISEEFYKDGLLRWEKDTFNLTKSLFNAKPIYKTVKKQDFIKFIEEFLGVEVVLQSFGPEKKDKNYNLIKI